MNAMNQIQQNDQDELSLFRASIDLGAVAESFGYQLDRTESNERTRTYRRDSGEKIIVSRGHCGHDIYLNCRSQAHGSVIDFVQQETSEGLGRTRRRLREFMGQDSRYPSFPTCPSLSPSTGDSRGIDEPDRRKCSEVWELATGNPVTPYLLERGLSERTLLDPRFVGTFRVNSTGAVMFLHRDRVGMTGYELRGIDSKTGFSLKGFMRRGKRALWYSNNLKQSTSVVICESAIDCLSHYELYGWDVAYVSIGGAISTLQKELLTGLFGKKPQIIVATDNDDSGQSYFEIMQSLTAMKLKRHSPIGKDWNDDLMTCVKENC